jgi:pyruvate dehydrogenase E2 component (dihydrolipoamide acetyltransferase)
MTETKQVLVPDIGDYKDVSVIEVMVKAGDTVNAEDNLITLETDKAAMDVPAPFGGVVQEVKVKVGDKVSQGSLILLLESGEAAAPTAQDDVLITQARDDVPLPVGASHDRDQAVRGQGPLLVRP